MVATDRPGPFGILLQHYRAVAGLSQEELAARASLSRRGVSDLERGERTVPHPATVRRLADALKLDGAERAVLLTTIHDAGFWSVPALMLGDAEGPGLANLSAMRGP